MFKKESCNAEISDITSKVNPVNRIRRLDYSSAGLRAGGSIHIGRDG